MKKRMLLLSLTCLLTLFFALNAFAAEGRIIIGIIPEVNLTKQMERFTPLCKYIEKKIGMEVGVKPLANYGLIYEEMKDGKIDAGFFGSFVYGMTRVRINIEPIARPEKADGISTYAGYTFSRKDSGIKSPEDMKGKTIALVDPATTAGYLAQKIYFKKHGVDIDKDVKIFWAGSHDAAAMAVFNKQADMGGAKNHPFNKIAKENAEFKDAVSVINESTSVPDNTFAVRKELDKKVVDKLKKALMEMERDEEGKEVVKKFGAARFIETTDKDFKNLYNMVKEAGIDLKTYSFKKQ